MKQVKYDFSDDVIFCHIMQNSDICKEVLEIILAENIAPIKNIISQNSLSRVKDAKTIRLDIMVETIDGKLYDIEMQIAKKHELPKRMRFYQSMLDLSYLQEGEHYRKLRDNYVIFICKFDFFKKNLPVYFFENSCKNDDSIKLNDGTKKIIINTTAFENAKNKKLQQLLAFIQKGTPSNTLTRRINEMVEITKLQKAAREFYQLISPYEMDIRDEGITEGLKEGHERGLKEGRELGLKEGRAEGIQQGISVGRAEGIQQGSYACNIEIVRNLQSMNMSNMDIAKVTGLSLEEVKAL
ncbi:MAG: Rpn family recombination-promoting nuclease/putative transposase [Treponema sp.]|nr:Rpn family recombination-promoting nuclease/putative transposase [Treponema sp.]